MTISKSKRIHVAVAAMLLFAGVSSVAADAASFSFVGNISRDDEVQLFDFTIGTSTNVIFKTLSWGGGTNGNGVTIDAGGFDPILTVFSADGTKIDSNDDGTSSQVFEDNGRFGDSYLTILKLAGGTYTVAISQSNNTPGATLTDPFSRQDDGDFTGAEFGCNVIVISLCASGGLPRDSHWAFDILGVNVASNPTGGNGNGGIDNSAVPIPAAFFLFGGALAGVGGLSRMKRKKA
jgi:hypothetical protein